YSALWNREAQCCQLLENEASQASRQSYGNDRQDTESHLVHRRLLEELAPREGMKILDVGSGSGKTVLLVAEKVAPTGKAVG
ncbi:MAG: hypothetical protein GTO54_01475, partial [Nitrososphaeria archaeon]|nr:hypothetical protein [Nitrososphaeria archaeon]